MNSPVLDQTKPHDEVEGRQAGDLPVIPIEFAGWLPCFREFGNCGRHPQFAHAGAPPAGYRFVSSEPKIESAPDGEEEDSERIRHGGTSRKMRKSAGRELQGKA